jgi:hypothetical protein
MENREVDFVSTNVDRNMKRRRFPVNIMRNCQPNLAAKRANLSVVPCAPSLRAYDIDFPIILQLKKHSTNAAKFRLIKRRPSSAPQAVGIISKTLDFLWSSLQKKLQLQPVNVTIRKKNSESARSPNCNTMKELLYAY